jgi:hypothetical protein
VKCCEDACRPVLVTLQRLFERRVSSKRGFNDATQLLLMLESLRINRRSDAYSEYLRLKNIWRKRQEAQWDIDRWMIRKGYPIY